MEADGKIVTQTVCCKHPSIHPFSIMYLRRFYLVCSAIYKWHDIDDAYRMRIKVALLTGMIRNITDTINLDRVKKASSSSSDIYSLWVWKSPQATALAQESSLGSVTKTTNRLLPCHIALWSIGIHTVLLYQIHSDDDPILQVKNSCSVLFPLWH